MEEQWIKNKYNMFPNEHTLIEITEKKARAVNNKAKNPSWIKLRPSI